MDDSDAFASSWKIGILFSSGWFKSCVFGILCFVCFFLTFSVGLSGTSTRSLRMHSVAFASPMSPPRRRLSHSDATR